MISRLFVNLDGYTIGIWDTGDVLSGGIGTVEFLGHRLVSVEPVLVNDPCDDKNADDGCSDSDTDDAARRQATRGRGGGAYRAGCRRGSGRGCDDDARRDAAAEARLNRRRKSRSEGSRGRSSRGIDNSRGAAHRVGHCERSVGLKAARGADENARSISAVDDRARRRLGDLCQHSRNVFAIGGARRGD